MSTLGALVSFLLLCFPESSKEQFASTNIAEELVHLFQKQMEHEKKEMIFEVLAPLAENGNGLFSLTPLLFFSQEEALEAAGLHMDIMLTTSCIVNDAVTHQANCTVMAAPVGLSCLLSHTSV